MVQYCCKVCGYYTTRRNQLIRHESTQKHINKTSRLKELIYNENTRCNKNKNVKNVYIDSEDHNLLIQKNVNNLCKEIVNKNESPSKVTNVINCQQKYLCEFCGGTYAHRNSYYRHVKHFCKMKNKHKKELPDTIIQNNLINVNNYNNGGQEITLADYKQFMSDMVDKMIVAFKENSNHKTEIKNYYQQNNTLNNSNYVIQFYNYNHADSMDNIKNKFKLTREEFIKASITSGYRGALIEKADNVIIKPYLKTQEKRPMHTVDSARKKALYKDEIHTEWTYYPKITLNHCFDTFHQSAVEHQDNIIKENGNQLIESQEDLLYKQTYFVPSLPKEKEVIYKEVENHIYKETKVKRNLIINKEDIEDEECLVIEKLLSSS